MQFNFLIKCMNLFSLFDLILKLLVYYKIFTSKFFIIHRIVGMGRKNSMYLLNRSCLNNLKLSQHEIKIN